MASARTRALSLAGAKSQFGIEPGYRHREKAIYFDDTAWTDEWQKEVYEYAGALAQRERLASVCDVGCGSAFKLMKHFSGYDTIGIDVPETVAFLKNKYPDRKWVSAPFSDRSIAQSDMVICSDVIEHVENPDALFAFLIHLAGKYLIISTPARERYEGRYYYGPPSNPAHVREWTFAEFGRYAASKVNVIEHRMTNVAQQTQMIVATRRN